MPDKKGKRNFPQLEFVVIEDEPAPPRVIIPPAKPAGAPPAKGKQRAEPVEVITIDDQPQPGPACNDKRTKQELLALIAKYEAERKTFQRRLESNEEYLEWERSVDSKEHERIHADTKKELAKTRAELAEAEAELARIEARDRRLAAALRRIMDGLHELKEDGYAVAHLQRVMQDVHADLLLP